MENILHFSSTDKEVKKSDLSINHKGLKGLITNSIQKPSNKRCKVAKKSNSPFIPSVKKVTHKG